jgi:hypothetical protein
MHVSWHFTDADRECVKKVMKEKCDHPMVKNRIMRNLAKEKDQVTKAGFWKALVCARITTRARITENGPYDEFQRNFPLRYNTVSNTDRRYEFIYDTLGTHEVGTDRKIIARQLVENFDFLQDGGWTSTRPEVNRLTTLQCRAVEAEVANYLAENFIGFGPKQSRNALQHLGLTRYEIPLDIRITKWLNDTLGFPFKITSRGLADKHVYGFVLDAICQLCSECKVFPCVLDAAIFVHNSGRGSDESGGDAEE